MLTYGFVLLIITAAANGLSTAIVLLATLFADSLEHISSAKLVAIVLIRGIFFTALFTIFAVTFAGPQHLAMLVIGAVIYGLGLIYSTLKIASGDSSGCMPVLIDLAMMVQYIVVAALI